MPSDIRIDISFPHHRKRKRLLHFLGPQGVVSLIDLWCKVAEQFPTGYLKDYTIDDIEIDAGWDGEPGKFVEILLDKKIRFLDKKEDGFHLHNWKKRQPWASNSEKRSNISRFNLLNKKNKDIHKELRLLGVKSISKDEYDYLVNSEATLKQRLKNFKHYLSECQKKSSEFKPNALLLLHTPSPVPLQKEPPKTDTKKFKQPVKKKKNPEQSSGKFLPKKTDVKNKDFTVNFTDTFLQINAYCKNIDSLPKNSKRKSKFNPRQWAQKQIGKTKHPGAIEKCLSGLETFWDTTRDPWGYLDQTLKKYNGNFNEAEAIKANKILKNESGSDALKNINWLAKEI